MFLKNICVLSPDHGRGIAAGQRLLVLQDSKDGQIQINQEE